MPEAKKPEAPKEETRVVDYKAELAKMAVAVAEAEKPSGNWISFKGGMISSFARIRST